MEIQKIDNEAIKIKLSRLLVSINRLKYVAELEAEQVRSTQLDFFTAYDDARFSFQVFIEKEVTDVRERRILMGIVDYYLDEG